MKNKIVKNLIMGGVLGAMISLLINKPRAKRIGKPLIKKMIANRLYNIAEKLF